MAKLINRARRARALLFSRFHRAPPGTELVFVEPCYWIADTLDRNSVILDIGLGNDADFSMAMIERYGLNSHGYDPTRKHSEGLQRLADASGGHFVFHAKGLGTDAGTATFYESEQNVSGSMFGDHSNVRDDAVTSYDVELITLESMLDALPTGRADLVKIDVEGIEYEVLEATSDDVLKRAGQWCIEFHHSTVEHFHYADTRRHVRRFRALGFSVFTRDGVDYLFYT